MGRKTTGTGEGPSGHPDSPGETETPGASGPSGGGPDAASMSYEEAVAELEAIIEGVESGSIGLEDSLASCERGAVLIRRCRELLADAEQRITDLDREMREGGERPGS